MVNSNKQQEQVAIASATSTTSNNKLQQHAAVPTASSSSKCMRNGKSTTAARCSLAALDIEIRQINVFYIHFMKRGRQYKMGRFYED
eukprot:14222883-Ditylum_brightwellii.AAC.1